MAKEKYFRIKQTLYKTDSNKLTVTVVVVVVVEVVAGIVEVMDEG